MKSFNFEQYSEQWWEIRRGVPTASRFHKIITPKTGKLSASADELICELVAERVQPGPVEPDRPINRAMEHGIQTEDEARGWYEFDRDAKVQQVGFCLSDCGRFGCSPDGLIGDDGGLELKCPELRTQVRYLLDGGLPDEYKAQVHGSLIVTGRQWWDFVSYAPGLPQHVVRVVPDSYTELLRAALDQFWERYQSILSRFTAKEAA